MSVERYGLRVTSYKFNHIGCSVLGVGGRLKVHCSLFIVHGLVKNELRVIRFKVKG